MTKKIKQPTTRWQSKRAYTNRTQRFHDVVTRVISFINRSEDSLRRAIEALLKRYKSVRIEKKLKGCLYSGSIVVTL